MTRDEFEHVLKAAADIVDDELVVIGSQAVLAEHPNAPAELLTSLELDVYPRTNPDRAIEIDGAIGDGSRFHDAYAVYAHGVGPETPSGAPAGWEQRLVRVQLPPFNRRKPPVVAWCMAPHDLVLAKLAAGREKDIAFAETAIRAGLVEVAQLRLGIDLIPPRYRELTRTRLEGMLARAGVG